MRVVRRERGTCAIFSAIAAKAAEDGEPASSTLGRAVRAFVKMVHNGIVYGDLKIIAEVYDLLHRGAGCPRASSRHLRGLEQWASEVY
jgi:6-phosphogluconate dehydrogenase